MSLTSKERPEPRASEVSGSEGAEGSGRFLQRHPLWVAFGAIVIFGALHALAQAYDILLLGFFAILIGVLFSFPVNLFSRVLPRALSVLLTLLLLAGGFTGVVFLTAPLVSEQTQNLKEQIPVAADRVNGWLTRSDKGPMSALPQGKKIAAGIRDRVAKGMGEIAAKVVPAALGIVSLVSTVILVVILGAFLVAQPQTYFRGLRLLVPKRHEQAFDQAWVKVGTGLRHWMGGIFVSMTIMGSLAALGLWLAGIQGWYLLGIFTFVGTFVPYAGAIASAIPGLLLGLAQSPTHFVYACFVYLGVHIVEGYLIQPLVMRRAVELRPGLLLFWQALMGSIFGLLGIMVATPLLVCASVLTEYYYVERNLKKPQLQREAA